MPSTSENFYTRAQGTESYHSLQAQLMKEQKSIPTTKVQRATKFITTGAKIGRNYLKHYGKKFLDPSTTKEQLHADNATDTLKLITDSLKTWIPSELMW